MFAARWQIRHRQAPADGAALPDGGALGALTAIARAVARAGRPRHRANGYYLPDWELR